MTLSLRSPGPRRAASRAVRCDASQALVTTGSQQALRLCAQVLLDPGERIWMEDPGSPGACRAFEAAGIDVQPVAVDAAAGAGVSAIPLSSCYMRTPARGGLVLGSGGVDEDGIREGVRNLKACLPSTLSRRSRR